MTGLFGVASKNCTKELFYGTDYHSHLAANWAGIAICNPHTSPGEEKIFKKSTKIETTQFKVEFASILNKIGNKGIGVLSNERQPIGKTIKHKDFAVASDVTVLNLEEILEELYSKNIPLSEASSGTINQTEIVSQLICQKDDLVDGMQYAMERIKGFCSILLVNEEGIYAARDKHGLNSLVLGKRKDGKGYAIASETCAFSNINFEIEKYLAPGEIVFFNENYYQTEKRLQNCKLKFCPFNWIYFSDPSSMHEQRSVEKVRNACGAALAEQDKNNGLFKKFGKEFIVCSVPDSGTGHAIGYANKSGLPFKRVLIKYSAGWSRSYMPANQQTRELIAQFKLIPVEANIKENNLILIDDSLRRGTQFQRLLREKIWPCGPKSIHARFASPPQLFPCIRDPMDASLLATRRAIKQIEGTEANDYETNDYSEYIKPASEKYQKMVTCINENLGATTTNFITLEEMTKATGLPADKLCLYCWTGKF
jgi:amidophosphoribosyltransferase